MQYLFLFTISPVQSFISQARKTQDLYAGSQMLSDMCKVAMEMFKAQNGKFIFPYKTENTSLPNRYLGKIDVATAEDAKQIGRAIEEKVRTEWYNQATTSIQKVLGEGVELPAGFDEQINNHLEIYWVFQELNINDNQGYKTAYNQIERALGAIKNLRMVNQYRYQMIKSDNNSLKLIAGERGRKCSIDGERNVKFYRLTPKEQTNKDRILAKKLFIDNSAEVLLLPSVASNILQHNIRNKKQRYIKKNSRTQPRCISPKYIQQGEGLSAISFYKRCYDSKSFPSTAKITLNSLLSQLGKNVASRINLLNFICHFGTDNFDEQLLFEENLTQDAIAKALNKESIDSSFFTKAHTLYNAIKTDIKQLNCAIHSYYAVIVFDGDNMGKHLSGDEKISADKLEKYHEKLSELLSIFSGWAIDKALKPHEGKAVYSGGDDFLGLVNLECLFSILTYLRQEFHLQVASPLRAEYPTQELLTFSAGIAIAHYKTPLSVVIQQARSMEAEAKRYKDEKDETKNAFAMAVLKKSGEPHFAVVPWGNVDACAKSLPLYSKQLASVLRLIQTTPTQKAQFSTSFIKTWAIELQKLNFNGNIKAFDIAITELKRLVERSSMATNSEQRKKQTNSMMDLLKPLLVANKETLKNLVEILNILDFIQRNTNGIENNICGD